VESLYYITSDKLILIVPVRLEICLCVEEDYLIGHKPSPMKHISPRVFVFASIFVFAFA
jgi:hypothetical protein